jgi:NAD(P)-dependent dehydrogenase (short-subunit alcohol dehydrogenase family)
MNKLHGDNMLELAGRTAFVTGAGGGLGLAMARAFAGEGAIVAMADINADVLNMAAASLPEGRGIPVICDVANRLGVKMAVDEFCASHGGGLDILVNNAVRFYYAPLVDMPEDEIDLMLSVGLKGAYWCLQAATPHLIERRGNVINLSSVAVSFAIRNAAVYTSIKGAIDALTRQQAVELGEHGVRVNAIAPGPVGLGDRHPRRSGARSRRQTHHARPSPRQSRRCA